MLQRTPPLRVCLVGEASSIHVRRWAVDLAGLGHRVAILSLGAGPEVPGIEVHRVRPAPPLLRQYLSRRDAQRFLRSFRPDIVHVHYLAAGPRALWPLGHGRLVVSLYGTDVEGVPGGLRGWVARTVMRRVLGRATAVSTPSRYLMGRAVADGAIQAPSIRAVIGFGVDCERLTPSPIRDSAEVVIGYAKGLRTYYGPLDLVDAVAHLVREGAAVRLRIAGGGPLEGELRDRVQRHGLSDRVELLGQLGEDALPAFFASIDIFAMPSHREAYGVAALEAAAAGRPVVATRVGGIPELVEDDVTGVLVPPREPAALAGALRRLVDDPVARRRMGNAGRSHACERHARADAVARMVELYRRALA